MARGAWREECSLHKRPEVEVGVLSEWPGVESEVATFREASVNEINILRWVGTWM